jgi:DNA-binding NarL/FixJ family response regulator
MKETRVIFVIEDSKILTEIIALQLKRKFDCNVLIFENGEAINKEIKKHSPDLIILDYNFNNKKIHYSNGLQILLKLREHYSTPVVVFSGQRDQEKATEILSAGASDYVSKDDDDFMETLLNSIYKIFSKEFSN